MKKLRKIYNTDNIFNTELFGDVRLSDVKSAEYSAVSEPNRRYIVNDVIRMDVLHNGELYTAEFNRLDVPDQETLRAVLLKIDKLYAERVKN